GLYSKLNGPHDTRINNWSAARDSVTDFNNNSRNVQCGAGFAGGDPPTACNPASPGGAPNPNIFDHGLSQGGSEALDLETTWAQTVRAPQMPKPADTAALDAGALVFGASCAPCPGGAKWTKSQVIYLNNPALDRAFAAGGQVRDPGLVVVANQSESYADSLVDGSTLFFLEDVGTFSAADAIEIRANGAASLGGGGFNRPSLAAGGFHAPYFHDGGAQTFDEVFAQHALAGGTIESELPGADRANLVAFLNALDGRTSLFRSQTDDFKGPFSP